jgi:hypothetical protein
MRTFSHGRHTQPRSLELNIFGDLEFVGFDGIGFVDLGGVFLHSHAWGKVPDQFLLYDIKIIPNPEANGAMRLPNLTGFSKEGIGAGKYKPRLFKIFFNVAPHEQNGAFGPGMLIEVYYIALTVRGYYTFLIATVS